LPYTVIASIVAAILVMLGSLFSISQHPEDTDHMGEPLPGPINVILGNPPMPDQARPVFAVPETGFYWA
jgi:uncharacterized membrane protein